MAFAVSLLAPRAPSPGTSRWQVQPKDRQAGRDTFSPLYLQGLVCGPLPVTPALPPTPSRLHC